MTEQNKQQISIGGLTFDVADVEYLTIKRDGYKIVIERDEDSKQNAVTGFAKQHVHEGEKCEGE